MWSLFYFILLFFFKTGLELICRPGLPWIHRDLPASSSVAPHPAWVSSIIIFLSMSLIFDPSSRPPPVDIHSPQMTYCSLDNHLCFSSCQHHAGSCIHLFFFCLGPFKGQNLPSSLTVDDQHIPVACCTLYTLLRALVIYLHAHWSCFLKCNLEGRAWLCLPLW